PGFLLGTPAYMSCEQASGVQSDRLDERSDIYSLGVVTYEMLTGRTPFRSDSPQGYIIQHVTMPPPPFRIAAPALIIPLQVQTVVMRALSKKPDDRYRAVLDFAYAFADAEKAACQIETKTPPPTIEVSRPQRAAQAPRPLESRTPLPTTEVIQPSGLEAGQRSTVVSQTSTMSDSVTMTITARTMEGLGAVDPNVTVEIFEVTPLRRSVASQSIKNFDTSVTLKLPIPEGEPT